MSDIPLKPCPFCGNRAIMIFEAHRLKRETYTPCCDSNDCKAQLQSFNDYVDAACYWNKRVGDE